MVGKLASISNSPKLRSFVAFETLHPIRKTIRMDNLCFPNRKSLNNEKRRKTLVFLNGFSMVGKLASISDSPKLCSFVAFEMLRGMRKTIRMDYLCFPDEESLNNEKTRKTLVFFNCFLHGWHTARNSNRRKLCSFAVLEKPYRMRKTRKEGYFSFSNEKSVNNEKRRKTLVFLNGFLNRWDSGKYF